MNSKYITSGNLDIYTESFGNEKNPAIILIAGAGSPCRFWINDFYEKLGKNYFVIRFDHRDTGLSSGINYKENPYTVYDLAKDVIAILDSHKIQKAHIVGQSMGGMITQILAMGYPDRVLSATIIASFTLNLLSEMNSKEKQIFEKTWKIVSENKPTKNFEEDLPGYMKVWKYEHGTMPLDDDIAIEFTKDLYTRSKHNVDFGDYHPHILAIQNLKDRTDDLKKIKVPVLIIHGEEDYLALPRITGQELHKLIPNSKLIMIPGMGHMILSRKLFDEIFNIIKKEIL
jgi:pimeloyl-ACP methyl ester carboxylesterase